MTGPLAVGAGGLRDAIPSFAGRVGVTIGLFVLLAGIGLAARYVHGRARSAWGTRVLNVGLGLGMLAIAAAITGALLALWDISVLALVEEPVTVATRIVLTLLLVVGTYLLTGVLYRVIHEFSEGRSAITRHQTELVYRVTQVSFYALALVVTFGIWRVNLGGLLVGAGFLGIVVGLAARQTLGALIAGFVLMFSRPFEIGDWVEIGDRDGIVTEITIVNTRIQTFDGEYVMLPNDVVGSSEIVNRSRKGRLRLRLEVGVDYTTDLERARDAAREAIGTVDDVLSVPRPQVVAKAFGDSAVVLELRFWIDKPSARRMWRARTAVIDAVKAAFDEEGIKIPFPQRELSGRHEDGGLRVTGAEPADTPVDAGSDAE